MNQFVQNLLRHRVLLVCLLMGIGISMGIGLFIVHYAKALSYLSSDPKACINCHIMRPQFDGWQKSSHHKVAGCIDCHLPHKLVPKYLAKAENGYHHSKAFTLQNFREPIILTRRNRKVLQANCVDCHRDMTHDLLSVSKKGKMDVDCIHCHDAVGHGEPVGLGGPDRSKSLE